MSLHKRWSISTRSLKSKLRNTSMIMRTQIGNSRERSLVQLPLEVLGFWHLMVQQFSVSVVVGHHLLI